MVKNDNQELQTKSPDFIPNFVGGSYIPAADGKQFDKIDPHSGKTLFPVARSSSADVENAVQAAHSAQNEWANTPPVKRGMILHNIVMEMITQKMAIAEMVSAETGKSLNDALGETGAAIECGLFYASEGQRLYGKTTTSGVPNKFASTIRQPIGVAGLIIAANTPIANVAWKVFPALICGNSVILKAAEDTPGTAWIFSKLTLNSGLPKGAFNIIQGYGEEAGAPLVKHPDVGVISFTGSTKVGKFIQVTAGERLARVSLELGGKNALIVCDDADLPNAVKWVLTAAFSNAGQRCASASRIIIIESIYEKFREMLLSSTRKLKLGNTNDDDLGPVINLRQLTNMQNALDSAQKEGAVILEGGQRLTDELHKGGFYLSPTLIENVRPDHQLANTELFGPITILFKVKDYQEALKLANSTPYGLTASIHTKNFHRANHFIQNSRTGVVVVNGGTHGSEPHMPFGGHKQSGNGSREPGTEALDVYSELKDIYINIDPALI